MATECDVDRGNPPDDWRGDFQSAEDRLLDASLATTPSQRLKWLEEALAFAAKVGALPTWDEGQQD
ncbi:MAG TPA: hypothetical protein VEK57_01050 [Thermoanaerobaculia bacterium]|nr:hypothetical protein [Thermoanaerobaculia bacterium]